MQITVTNTATPLTSLLSSADAYIAEKNRSSAKAYNVTLYNADSTSTDIVYLGYGETVTTSEGIPIFAPAGSTSAGDSYSLQTGDLSQISLISSVASTTVNVLITPLFI